MGELGAGADGRPQAALLAYHGWGTESDAENFRRKVMEEEVYTRSPTFQRLAEQTGRLVTRSRTSSSATASGMAPGNIST